MKEVIKYVSDRDKEFATPEEAGLDDCKAFEAEAEHAQVFRTESRGRQAAASRVAQSGEQMLETDVRRFKIGETVYPRLLFPTTIIL